MIVDNIRTRLFSAGWLSNHNNTDDSAILPFSIDDTLRQEDYSYYSQDLSLLVKVHYSEQKCTFVTSYTNPSYPNGYKRVHVHLLPIERWIHVHVYVDV